jgi:hypothetical protein
MAANKRVSKVRSQRTDVSDVSNETATISYQPSTVGNGYFVHKSAYINDNVEIGEQDMPFPASLGVAQK